MELILYTLRALASVIFEPVLLIMLIILAIIFYSKNKRIIIMQKMIIGEPINNEFGFYFFRYIFYGRFMYTIFVYVFNYINAF